MRSGCSRDHKNAFWQVAYHALFFTHLLLQQNEAAFRRWSEHRGDDDGTTGAPYTKAQVLEYWSFVDQIVDSAVDSLDLENPESGFGSYQVEAGASIREHPPCPASCRAVGRQTPFLRQHRN